MGLCCAALAAQGPSLVISHVTVVDTRAGASQPDMTVVIRGDRIAQIRKSDGEPGEEATVVDGQGKFLIPGLWDMEVHLSWTTASALPLLVANGVTHVRDMGGSLEQIDDWRTRISAGLLIGPSISRVGPMLNGKSFNRYQMVIGPPAEARGVVRTLKFIGVDGLSLERRVPRDSYFALMEEAKRQHLPVGGHVPIGVGPAEASDAGQTTIENVDALFDVPPATLASAIERFLSSGAADMLFTRFAKNRTAYTPAISTYGWSLADADPSAPKDPRKKYVARSLRDFYAKHPLAPADLKAMRAAFPLLVKVTGRMQHDGVTLLAGTDIAGPRIPGFSLHDELSMLVKAGLTPLQALQTATLNPAIVLGRTQDLGTVEPGRAADLLLLDGDPLKNIDNTRRISAVILGGGLFGRSELDILLGEAERMASQN